MFVVVFFQDVVGSGEGFVGGDVCVDVVCCLMVVMFEVDDGEVFFQCCVDCLVDLFF